MNLKTAARLRVCALLSILGPTFLPTVLSAQAPIRGFPQDALARRARLEAVLRETPDTARLRASMRRMAAEPHHAGSPASRAVAEWALAQLRSWGLEARIDTSEALMPVPVMRRLELVAPTTYVARLAEPLISEDEDTGDAGQLPTFNAYSPDGDVTAELVYANYGLPDDYDELARRGIAVRGRIVIVKYGGSWRGIKPKVAAEHGAVGCIIYSDPRDDGYWGDWTYPQGPMRPEMGAQRGSVMDMPTYPGDPLTPGWGARPGGRKLPRDSAQTIARIPVLPISYGDALPFLRALGGAVAPDEWKGALPITYHIGPGPARVHLALQFDWQVRPLYDVIARIPGASAPDQWVIHGNHHDAWVNGAEDPVSGAIALLETARSFAELRRTGWRPQRTIVLALWDGEEWGLLGSTEWAEANADALRTNAVAYFNSDTNGRGPLGASGSHTLETFVREVARDGRDPQSGKDELEARADFALSRARSADDSAQARLPFRIGALGSGSDYTAFIDHLGIASVDMRHGGAQDDGIYHSIYDTYTFYARFHDTTFAYGKAQAGAMGVALLRLADAPILPFSFSDAAATYGRYAAEIDTLARQKLGGNGLDLAAVRAAVDSLAAAGQRFDWAMNLALGRGTAWLEQNGTPLAAINRDVYQSERDLTDDAGLPRRAWFRHRLYAPGFYTGYGVKTMPGIREAVEQRDAAEAAAQAQLVSAAILRMAARADKAARDLLALRP
jgi:N-acetylated-alpha-linked acidic dipeptidase